MKYEVIWSVLIYNKDQAIEAAIEHTLSPCKRVQGQGHQKLENVPQTIYKRRGVLR